MTLYSVPVRLFSREDRGDHPAKKEGSTHVACRVRYEPVLLSWRRIPEINFDSSLAVCSNHLSADLYVLLELQEQQAPPPYALDLQISCAHCRPALQVMIGNVDCCSPDLKMRLTTFRTLFSVCAGIPFPALQSSPRYGADTTTESITTMLFPSHRVGSVRLRPSKRS